MKLLKKFYLFIVWAPMSAAFFIVFIPSAFALLQFVIYCEKTDKENSYFRDHFFLGLIIAITLFVLLAFINYMVIKSKITKVSVKVNELTLIHYPAPGNEVEIARRSVWGKYLKSIIKFPLNWGVNLHKGDENSFYMLITIIVNSEVRLFIPVTLNFIFSGPFKANDLRLKLMNGYIHDEVDVDKFITEKFNSLNLSGETFSKMTQDAKSYYNKNMSKREFIDCMQHNIKFPKLFSNVASTGVTIGKPRFNYSTLLNTETEI